MSQQSKQYVLTIAGFCLVVVLCDGVFGDTRCGKIHKNYNPCSGCLPVDEDRDGTVDGCCDAGNVSVCICETTNNELKCDDDANKRCTSFAAGTPKYKKNLLGNCLGACSGTATPTANAIDVFPSEKLCKTGYDLCP